MWSSLFPSFTYVLVGDGIAVSDWHEQWDNTVDPVDSWDENPQPLIFRIDSQGITTGIYSRENSSTSKSFSLSQNYPNPFNPSTTIEYEIPQAGNVEITIYNSLGQQVKSLINRKHHAGKYYTVWDGTNDQGQRVATGTYYYQIKKGEFRQARKIIMIK